ncbi:MAG: class I SAM-dependent methyltransferase [Cyanobacteria bacterium P01_G01_bin.49]
MYKEDLAYIHNQGFGHLADNAVSVILNAFKESQKTQGLLIDLGCGSGITAAKLLATGYDVIGVDLSADLIAIARQRVPQGKFYLESFFNFPLPFCEAVIAIGECFNYLFDQQNTPENRLKLFQKIHDCLSVDGFFLLDIAEPGRVPNEFFRTYTETNNWVVLMTAREDQNKKQLSRKITTFRKIGELYRREQEVHHLCLLERRELLEQLRTIGFQVEILEGYGSLTFSPGHIGLLARKL